MAEGLSPEPKESNPLDLDIKQIYEQMVASEDEPIDERVFQEDAEEGTDSYIDTLDQNIEQIIQRDGAHGLSVLLLSVTEHFFSLYGERISQGKSLSIDKLTNFIVSLSESLRIYNQTSPEPLRVTNADLNDLIDKIANYWQVITHPSLKTGQPKEQFAFDIQNVILKGTESRPRLKKILSELAELTEQPDEATAYLEQALAE